MNMAWDWPVLKSLGWTPGAVAGDWWAKWGWAVGLIIGMLITILFVMLTRRL